MSTLAFLPFEAGNALSAPARADDRPVKILYDRAQSAPPSLLSASRSSQKWGCAIARLKKEFSLYSGDSQPSLREPKWIDTEAPAEGQIVRIQALDDGGHYVVPFPVQFRDDGWRNAETGEELDCFVAGWMPWEGR